MKKTNWSDGLSSVTRGIMIFCGILLVIVAITVMFLMFFPIVREDHPTVVVEPARHTEYSATTRATTARTEPTTTTSHTLSTWAAVPETLATTLDPDETTDIPWYDKLFTRHEKIVSELKEIQELIKRKNSHSPSNSPIYL